MWFRGWDLKGFQDIKPFMKSTGAHLGGGGGVGGVGGGLTCQCYLMCLVI